MNGLCVACICLLVAIGGCGDRRTERPTKPAVTSQTSSDGTHSKLKKAAPQTFGIDFAEVAADIGLTHSWPVQPRPMRVKEAFGCGCAVFDFDQDGWQDVLLVADPHPVLYRNESGMRFRDVTESTRLTEIHQSDWTGCAIGDYDGDGWLDVLLTGMKHLGLFRNVSGQHFADVTESAGLDPKNHQHWGASAGFMDLNGDAWLDLVILNFVEFGPESKQYCEMIPGIRSGCRPQEYPPEQGEIWVNSGSGGFQLVPRENGMASTTGIGLVLAFADLDDDRLMDFYIGNDGVVADLMHNQGGLKFENQGHVSGLAYGKNFIPMAAMGADWGDYDRDGKLDLTVSNWDRRSFAVFRNQGGLFFTDMAAPTGVERITASRLGFGSNWMDFDNDSWLDLAFVNGHVYDNATMVDAISTFRQATLLLRNEQGKSFRDLVPALSPEVGRLLLGRGSATLDFDNDGRMDFVAVDYEGPAYFLHNRSRTENHWLKLNLRGTSPNTHGYGARVVGKAGDRIWISEVSPASSYLSSKDPRIHWGLGDCQVLDSVVVRWPSGREQVLRDVAADQILTVTEPQQ